MAAHAISITDGTTTVNLNVAGANVTTDYKLGTLDSDSGDIEAEPTITETINVMLRASTGPLLQAAINSVEKLLVAAKRRQKYKTTARVYLQMQIDGESNTWRAEIVDGHFEPDDDFLKIGIANLRAEGALMVTHRVWEGPRTELQLSTSNASAATGGRTIYNHDDSGTGHDNWVQIASSQVGGVLPTPVEIQLINTSGTSVGFRNFYLATNAFSDPANFAHILEGEDSASGSNTSNAASSGGLYEAYSFTDTGSIAWALSATVMGDTQGRVFRLLARMFSWGGAPVYVQPVLYETNGNLALATGDEVRLPSISGSQIIDLGELPLPPGGYQASWGGTVLKLLTRATGSASVNVDFIQLTPLDAYQYIVQRGYSIANSGTITFDNIEELYHANGQSIYSPRSGPLKVFPGVTQKIIMLSDEGTTSDITRTFTIRAYIRERRLTV